MAPDFSTLRTFVYCLPTSMLILTINEAPDIRNIHAAGKPNGVHVHCQGNHSSHLSPQISLEVSTTWKPFWNFCSAELVTLQTRQLRYVHHCYSITLHKVVVSPLAVVWQYVVGQACGQWGLPAQSILCRVDSYISAQNISVAMRSKARKRGIKISRGQICHSICLRATHVAAPLSQSNQSLCGRI